MAKEIALEAVPLQGAEAIAVELLRIRIWPVGATPLLSVETLTLTKKFWPATSWVGAVAAVLVGAGVMVMATLPDELELKLLSPP